MFVSVKSLVPHPLSFTYPSSSSHCVTLKIPRVGEVPPHRLTLRESPQYPKGYWGSSVVGDVVLKDKSLAMYGAPYGTPHGTPFGTPHDRGILGTHSRYLLSK
ncbi:MAG: hypothetical protein DRJ40_10755 [Thermoprotei archaeon]|nr:MAG: hypothetical protein DRJ40_10755 [Thermoprotei archaeon]